MREIYPKYKYHHTHEPKVVNTPEEEAELGDEWKESPADHLHKAEKPIAPSVDEEPIPELVTEEKLSRRGRKKKG